MNKTDIKAKAYDLITYCIYDSVSNDYKLGQMVGIAQATSIILNMNDKDKEEQ